MTDAVLLDRWKAGDKEAGQQLISSHYEAVHGFFARKADASATDDLTQSTFETLCKTIGRGDLANHLRAHLFAIARNKLLEYYRRSCTMRQRFDPLLHSVCDTDLDRSIVSLIGSKRRVAVLYLSLRRLPLDAQLLIELKHYEGFTAPELARMYDETPSAIRSRLHRARERLRDEIQSMDEGIAAQLNNEIELSDYLESLRGYFERMSLPGPIH